mmetsp:Transcript_75661/g.119235  ORF Transcript_75661/g.119235 Transcript_75661/m.119235 type:complete len:86 (+) Transcript_75661:53-310(+)
MLSSLFIFALALSLAFGSWYCIFARLGCHTNQSSRSISISLHLWRKSGLPWFLEQLLYLHWSCNAVVDVFSNVVFQSRAAEAFGA